MTGCDPIVELEEWIEDQPSFIRVGLYPWLIIVCIILWVVLAIVATILAITTPLWILPYWWWTRAKKIIFYLENPLEPKKTK